MLISSMTRIDDVLRILLHSAETLPWNRSTIPILILKARWRVQPSMFLAAIPVGAATRMSFWFFSAHVMNLFTTKLFPVPAPPVRKTLSPFFMASSARSCSSVSFTSTGRGHRLVIAFSSWAVADSRKIFCTVVVLMPTILEMALMLLPSWRNTITFSAFSGAVLGFPFWCVIKASWNVLDQEISMREIVLHFISISLLPYLGISLISSETAVISLIRSCNLGSFIVSLLSFLMILEIRWRIYKKIRLLYTNIYTENILFTTIILILRINNDKY